MFFCLHFKTKKKKMLRIFKNLIFFTILKTFKTHFYFIFIIYKPSLWSRDVPQKIWARSFQPFWRLLDTNIQTDKPNLYLEDYATKTWENIWFGFPDIWRHLGKYGRSLFPKIVEHSQIFLDRGAPEKKIKLTLI